MALFIGLMLILWGVFVLYSCLFRMQIKDYKDLGISGNIEWDLLFKLLGKFPPIAFKSFVLLIGVALIVLGVIIL